MFVVGCDYTAAESVTADVIADLLCEQIERIGAERVFGVVTDNGPNVKAAWPLISSKYEWITFTCYGFVYRKDLMPQI